MKKVLLIALISLLIIPNMVMAEEAVEETAIAPVAVEQSEVAKNLDLLIERYKSKQKELIVIEKDLLRIEGAIVICQNMIKEENAKD